MKEEEFIEILTDVFNGCDINSSPYESASGIKHSRLYIKSYSPKLKSKVVIATSKRSELDDFWNITFSFINQSFTFKVEIGFEKQSLLIMKDWFEEYQILSLKNHELLNKYDRIRKNFKEELRDYQLKKLI